VCEPPETDERIGRFGYQMLRLGYRKAAHLVRQRDSDERYRQAYVRCEGRSTPATTPLDERHSR